MFRSSPMIFGRVIALGLKFGQIFSCHHFFSLCLEILNWFLVWEWVYTDIWYMSVADQVYISFRSNDFWPIYGPWTLKFGQIFSCHHFIIPPLPEGGGGYTVLPLSFRLSKIFFSVTVDGRNLIPTSCLLILLIFIHI